MSGRKSSPAKASAPLSRPLLSQLPYALTSAATASTRPCTATRSLKTSRPTRGDREHAAAAIYGDVDVLLTRNLKHLSTAPVLAAGVKVMTSDEFLCALLSRRRLGVVESFTRAAGNKKNPTMTPDALAEKVAAAGAPRFAERIRQHAAS